MVGEKGETMKWIVNGEIVPEGDAGLSFGDRGALLGDGLFETFRVEQGVPLFMREHLKRLREGMQILRFAVMPDEKELIAGIRQALVVNGVESGYLRLTVTRGTGSFAQPLAALTEPVWWVEARSMPLQMGVLEHGVEAIVASTCLNPHSRLRRVKSLNFLENVLAKQEARDRGADEAIFLTTDEAVSEGASANLFLVKKGVCYTPSLACGPLPGVVRGWVLATAARLGLTVVERSLQPGELTAADELFFTNSTWGPFPCVAVDGVTIDSGKPGPYTCKWMEQWQEEVAAQIEADRKNHSASFDANVNTFSQKE
ncbi:aminotransferase class IV [Desmospora activa]|uniref:Branched-chain amino acid aminotransferase n=1 Tax=Desmospora activa DSM 45169 TaxID=1121389 RepID=A0A2T4Z6U5_9BACL|nr:aminotransferase class IV [Desmospora activa]PTM57614.1 branched-chain amino acid aminotransferase [Desmospora activa DSM 45169]